MQYLLPFLFSSGYVFISFLFSSYRDYFKKSRVSELLYSFVIGCFYFTTYKILSDDTLFSYETKSSLPLAFIEIVFGHLIIRTILLNFSKSLIRSKKVFFNTIILGSGEKAQNIYLDLKKINNSLGHKFLGSIPLSNISKRISLEIVDSLENIEKHVIDNNIHEVIIAPELEEEYLVPSIITSLEGFPLTVSIIPDIHQIIAGKASINHIVGVPIIQVNSQFISIWYLFFKRLFDLFFSISFLIIGSPLFILCSILVKISSKGPVFFLQERVGYHGKHFKILKFRSMYQNAESSGPRLSTGTDPRITKWGVIMRKTRLDEIPQFINVIKGEMTVVGPRPERKFYIDQILEKAPHFKHMLKVKPGITSLGQVKFGYAENVDQMIQRLKYDMLYIENMSLTLDFRILVYTVFTVLKGKGK